MAKAYCQISMASCIWQTGANQTMDEMTPGKPARLKGTSSGVLPSSGKEPSLELRSAVRVVGQEAIR